MPAHLPYKRVARRGSGFFLEDLIDDTEGFGLARGECHIGSRQGLETMAGVVFPQLGDLFRESLDLAASHSLIRGGMAREAPKAQACGMQRESVRRGTGCDEQRRHAVALL